MSGAGVTAWALVPARGGSKSIPDKNLVPLLGVPLLDYGVRAALSSGCFDRIVCSTDDRRIGERARELGIDVDWRPAHLATDGAAVADVATEFLRRERPPDVLVLVQPTSPFLLAEHIEAVLQAMARDEAARSGQTVTVCPHNHHAWNQREVENGRVRFRFAAERARAFNKQAKPKLYIFGNLVAARPAALFDGDSFFAEPSVAVEIAPPYDIDIDGPADLVAAEALLTCGAVTLPHMHRAVPGVG
jgi:CMP-N-acetylneuraminic acid synthetase